MENKTIYQKLLEIQKKIGAIKKDKENPFFKSKYADINAYIEEVKPILNEHGLIILQPLLVIRQGCNAIKTIIIDSKSGENISSIIKLPDNPDPQKMGSTITYFRRYAIQSMLFLQAEDDDGNATQGSTIPRRGYRLKDGVEYKLDNEPKKKVEKLPTINEGDTPF